MSTLQGKTLFITGASRGIGLAIALLGKGYPAIVARADPSRANNGQSSKSHPKSRDTPLSSSLSFLQGPEDR